MGETFDPVRAIESLSQGQIDVLFLVSQYKSSKEIGRELGISNHTVDQRIKRIQVILNVSSRAQAARIFAAARNSNEQKGLWGDLVYQSSELSEQPFSSTDVSSSGDWNQAGDGGNSELREAQARYFASDFGKFEKPSWFSVLFEASRSNELTPTARTAVIALIMLISLLGLSALIGLAEGMSRIF
jgi:DNA-binding CsgD family transcriptional regulator